MHFGDLILPPAPSLLLTFVIHSEMQPQLLYPLS